MSRRRVVEAAQKGTSHTSLESVGEFTQWPGRVRHASEKVINPCAGSRLTMSVGVGE